MALRVGPWGARKPAPPPEPAPEATPDEPGKLVCEQCGAVLSYQQGTSQLTCQYCGHSNPIAEHPIEIVENDLRAALDRGLAQAPQEETSTVKCQSCAAEFTFDPNRHAGACPFCGQSIVTDTGTHRQIKPAALLPFVVEQRDARERVRKWLGALWFAPSSLKRFARTEGRLSGMYLPYWTYDSRTRTAYSGQRGTVYHEPVQMRTVVDGKPVVQTRMVQKVRWRSVSGRVARDFDDVLVLASRSLPTWLTDRLEPWDLQDLKAYAPEYVAGFQSEAYQVPLDEGFAVADDKMHAVIAGDVKADIGGDVQRIGRMEVEHQGPSFKHVLLPVWLGAFRHGGKVYRLCVNGRTGEVQGERPYSVWKIAFVVLLLAILLGLFLYAYGGQLQ
jgi:DNA-directed RNA polymerase subunit RPC12/RpoP